MPIDKELVVDTLPDGSQVIKPEALDGMKLYKHEIAFDDKGWSFKPDENSKITAEATFYYLESTPGSQPRIDEAYRLVRKSVRTPREYFVVQQLNSSQIEQLERIIREERKKED